MKYDVLNGDKFSEIVFNDGKVTDDQRQTYWQQEKRKSFPSQWMSCKQKLK